MGEVLAESAQYDPRPIGGSTRRTVAWHPLCTDYVRHRAIHEGILLATHHVSLSSTTHISEHLFTNDTHHIIICMAVLRLVQSDD